MSIAKPLQWYDWNRTHPIADGLNFLTGLWTGHGATAFDLVDGLKGSFVGAPVWDGEGIIGDGANDYIDFGTDPRLVTTSDPFTIAWRERVVGGPFITFAAICCFMPDGGSRRFIVMRSTSGSYSALSVGRIDGGAGIQFASAPSMASSENIWRTWVLVGTAGTDSVTNADWTLYVDGVPYVAEASGSFLNSATALNYIGWDGSDGKWKGGIGWLGVWDRALAPTEGIILSGESHLLLQPPVTSVSMYFQAPVTGVNLPAIMRYYRNRRAV